MTFQWTPGVKRLTSKILLELFLVKKDFRHHVKLHQFFKLQQKKPKKLGPKPEAYLVSYHALNVEIFYKHISRLKAINYFRKKGLSDV